MNYWFPGTFFQDMSLENSRKMVQSLMHCSLLIAMTVKVIEKLIANG